MCYHYTMLFAFAFMVMSKLMEIKCPKKVSSNVYVFYNGNVFVLKYMTLN